MKNKPTTMTPTPPPTEGPLLPPSPHHRPNSASEEETLKPHQQELRGRQISAPVATHVYIKMVHVPGADG